MNYLIICKSDSKLFLMLNENNSVTMYPTKKDIMQAFKGYTEAWVRDYESSMSACIGMMNIAPIAIEAPEKPEDLRQYFLDDKIYKISGGAIGRGYKGALVKEEILEFKQFDIWKETMIAAGITAPDDKQLDLFPQT